MQRAASLGAQVTPHEPQGPIAGALQDAPTCAFCCFTSCSFFFFLELSCANAGFSAKHAAMSAAAIVPIFIVASCFQ
jgi:hypothetical protein